MICRTSRKAKEILPIFYEYDKKEITTYYNHKSPEESLNDICAITKNNKSSIIIMALNRRDNWKKLCKLNYSLLVSWDIIDKKQLKRGKKMMSQATRFMHFRSYSMRQANKLNLQQYKYILYGWPQIVTFIIMKKMSLGNMDYIWPSALSLIISKYCDYFFVDIYDKAHKSDILVY